MEGPVFDALTQRLNRLERTISRLKRGGAAALSICAAFLLLGQAMPRGRIVEGEQFILRDSSGNARAQMDAPPDGSVRLVMYDTTGLVRAGVSVAGDGSPGLSLFAKGQKRGAGLALGSDGSAVLMLGDRRITLTALSDGSSSLMVSNNSGKPRLELGVDSDTTPVLRMWDSKGLTARLKDHSLVLYGPGEKPHVVVVVNVDGAALLLTDKDGKPIWRAP